VKLRALFGFFLLCALCGCAANSPNSETMIDTSTKTKQTVRPEAPPRPPLAEP
jgi:hypothetical protein